MCDIYRIVAVLAAIYVFYRGVCSLFYLVEWFMETRAVADEAFRVARETKESVTYWHNRIEVLEIKERDSHAKKRS